MDSLAHYLYDWGIIPYGILCLAYTFSILNFNPIMKENLLRKCEDYLKTLCVDIIERCVGSEGNRQATYFLEKVFSQNDWETEMVEFDAIDWEQDGATLRSVSDSFDVLVSPYSTGFRGEGVLVPASTIEELSSIDAEDKIILLHGEIAREQLCPELCLL